MKLGGRWWVLDHVLPGPEQVKGEPPSRNIQRLAGYMTLIGPDTANFDAAGMPTMQFVPTEDEPPGCAQAAACAQAQRRVWEVLRSRSGDVHEIRPNCGSCQGSLGARYVPLTGNDVRKDAVWTRQVAA